MLSLPDLNYDVLHLVFKNLEDRDRLSLGLTTKKLNAFYNLLSGRKPFLGTIKRDLKAIGYLVPNLEEFYNGINDVNLEKKLSYEVFNYKQIRSQLNYANINYVLPALPSSTRDSIDDYITKLEKDLHIPKDPEQAYTYLKFILQNFDDVKTGVIPISNRFLLNPIYLRIYLDLLNLRSFILQTYNPGHGYHKKLTCVTLLLIRAKDAAGLLCLVDLLKKYVVQQPHNRQMLNDLKALLSTLPKQKEIPTLNSDDDIVSFACNVVEKFGNCLTKYPPVIRKFFFDNFDFLSFYFYPKNISKFLKNCLTNESNIENFFKLPSKLCLLFSTDPAYILYNKVFNDKVTDNIENIQYYENKNGISYVIETLSTVLKNKASFEKLLLTEILNLPQDIINLAPENFAGEWTYASLCNMTQSLNKFIFLRECSKNWSPEQIKDLLSDKNEPIFAIIKQCEHKQLIFSKFKTVDDLKFLHANSIKETNLLELLCAKGSSTLCKLILENSSDVSSLIQKIQNNSLRIELLTTKNADLILKHFPTYALLLKVPHTPKYSTEELGLLKKLATEVKYFELAVKLYQRNIKKMINDAKLIELLFNPILFNLIEFQCISIESIKANFSLFEKLYITLHEQHCSIMYMPLDRLIVLNNASLLDHLLKIKSQSLFNWILFDSIKLNEIDKNFTKIKNNSNDIKTLKEMAEFRNPKDIAYLFNSEIIFTLEKFGYFKNKTQFIHCDSFLLDYLGCDLIKKLNFEKFNEDTTFLARICSFNPGLFLCAINNSNSTISDKFLYLKLFYSQACLEYLKLSDHAWLTMLYFDTDLIKELLNLELYNTNALYFLLQPANKALFMQLVRKANTLKILDIKLNILIDQPLPSHYTVDPEKFLKIFRVFLTTQLLKQPEKCVCILKYYNNLDDLLSLSDTPVEDKQIKNVLELLMKALIRFDFNEFCGNYPNLSDVIDKQDEILLRLNNKQNLVTLSNNFSNTFCPLDVTNPRLIKKHKRKRVRDNDEQSEDTEKNAHKKQK